MNTKSKLPILVTIIMSSILFTNCSPGQLLGPTFTPSPTNTETPTITPTHLPTNTPTFTPTITPIPTATTTPIPIIIGKWSVYTEWGDGYYTKSEMELSSDNTVKVDLYITGYKFTNLGFWSYVNDGEWQFMMKFHSAKYSGKIINQNSIKGIMINTSGRKGTWHADR
jgi:hypothetical protein